MKRLPERLLYILLCFLFAALYHPVTAQNKRRLEVEGHHDNVQLVPLSENGLVLFSEVSKGKYNFVKYDPNLEQLWSVSCDANSNLDPVQYTYEGQSVYLLLARQKSADYQVIKLNTTLGFIEKFDIYSLNRFDITEFKAHLNDVYVAGKVKNDPVLLHINLITNQSRLLPIHFKGTADI